MIIKAKPPKAVVQIESTGHGVLELGQQLCFTRSKFFITSSKHAVDYSFAIQKEICRSEAGTCPIKVGTVGSIYPPIDTTAVWAPL